MRIFTKTHGARRRVLSILLTLTLTLTLTLAAGLFAATTLSANALDVSALLTAINGVSGLTATETVAGSEVTVTGSVTGATTMLALDIDN
jgi:hypothetical protein